MCWGVSGYEGNPDPLLLAPHYPARLLQPIRRDNQGETLRDANRTDNIQAETVQSIAPPPNSMVPASPHCEADPKYNRRGLTWS